MSGKPLPAYLRLVPPPGKRFRPPRKPETPPTLARDGADVARVVAQAERVQALVERMRRAVWENDELVVKALLDRVEIETRYAAGLVRGLREGLHCA